MSLLDIFSFRGNKANTDHDSIKFMKETASINKLENDQKACFEALAEVRESGKELVLTPESQESYDRMMNQPWSGSSLPSWYAGANLYFDTTTGKFYDARGFTYDVIPKQLELFNGEAS